MNARQLGLPAKRVRRCFDLPEVNRVRLSSLRHQRTRPSAAAMGFQAVWVQGKSGGLPATELWL